MFTFDEQDDMQVVSISFDSMKVYLEDGSEASLENLSYTDIEELKDVERMNEECGADYVIMVNVEDGYVVYFAY